MQTKTEEVYGYQRQIQEATGAPVEILAILERILRDEIFHSTLDRQTARQFNSAARKALKMYHEAQSFYDADQALQAARWTMSLAEVGLKEVRKTGDAIAIGQAKATFDEACAAHDRALQKVLSFR